MDTYTTCISIAIAYLLLCRILRYRVRDSGPKRYGIDPNNRETFKKLSLQQSYEIFFDLIALESPFLYDIAAFSSFVKVSSHAFLFFPHFSSVEFALFLPLLTLFSFVW